MEQNWQSDILCIKDRAAYLLKREKWTDVTFVVCKKDIDKEPKTFHAHKLILANASSVFEAMFYGPMSHKTADVVLEEVPGSDGAFSNFLMSIKYSIDGFADCFNFLKRKIETFPESNGTLSTFFTSVKCAVDKFFNFYKYLVRKIENFSGSNGAFSYFFASIKFVVDKLFDCYNSLLHKIFNIFIYISIFSIFSGPIKFALNGFSNFYEFLVRKTISQSNKLSKIEPEISKTSNEVIQVEDVDAQTFSDMLKYMYTDEIDLDSWYDAANLYCAAKIYFLSALFKYCMEYMHKELNANNALKIFEFANFYEENDLLHASLKVIREKTLLVFSSPDFFEIDMPTMMTILEQDELQATASDLFEALETLAIAKNVIEGKKLQISSSENKNECTAIKAFEDFRAAVKRVNFLSFSVEQFLNGPEQSKLLLPEEKTHIIRCLVARTRVDDIYPKDFSKNLSKKKLPRTFFDFKVDGVNIGRIIMELREDVVPETVEHFLAVFTGKKPYSYKGSKLTKIRTDLPYLCVQVSSGQIDPISMTAENVILNPHKPGTISTTTIIDNKVSTHRFSIGYESMKEFNGQKVVFGHVVEGMEYIKTLASYGTQSGTPTKNIEIENCGQLN